MQSLTPSIQDCLSYIGMIPALAAKMSEVQNQLAILQPHKAEQPEGEGWLNTKEAARYLSMSENTFDKFCRETNPRIKGYKVGGKNYYKKSDLDIFMKMYAIKSQISTGTRSIRPLPEN